jgi:hypothetical protein
MDNHDFRYTLHHQDCFRDEFFHHRLWSIIQYLEQTAEDSWCTDVVKTHDNKNCLFGHIYDYGFSINPTELYASNMYDWFDCAVSTTHQVFRVNDGQNSDYPEATPKQRCLAYLKNIFDGKEFTTLEGMDHDYLLSAKNKARASDIQQYYNHINTTV